MFADFDIFYAAAKALLNGVSPYTVPGFYNPAWALLPFIPLTLLPIDTARVVYVIMTITGVLIALYRFRLKPIVIAAIALLSPLLWLNVVYANVDWLVLLGATFPAPFGIWLVMVKPQMAIGICMFWLLRRETRRPIVFVPVALALVLNYALLGMPDFSLTGRLEYAPADMFPYGLPVALWLIVQALRQSSVSFALPAAIFASPYLGTTSWIHLSPLARSWRWLATVLIVSWIMFLIWRSGI